MSPGSVHITFRHTPASPAVEARIQQEAAALARFFDRITSCHVVIEAPHHHHRPQGRTWRVGIHLHVPGAVITVDHEPTLHSGSVEDPAAPLHKHDESQPDHRDIYVCIRDAFSAARRQLEDHARKTRGDVKHHQGPAPP